MKTGMRRLYLCVLAIVTVCGSGRGSSAVEKELGANGLHPKNMHQPGGEPGTTEPEVTCIANWQDLFYIYEKESKEKRTPLIPSSRSTHPMLLIHIRNYVGEDSSVYNSDVTINSSSYCQLSDSEDECAMIAVYSQSTFDVYPAALLILLGGVFEYAYLNSNDSDNLRCAIMETSWALLLPFCSGHFQPEIVEDFVYELMKSATDNQHLAIVDNHITSFRVENEKSLSTWNALLLNFLLVSSSAAILLVLCRFTKWYLLHSQRVRNAVCKSLLLSSMIQSWMWFVYLYGYQFWGLSLFKDFLHSKNAVISTAYMPFVNIGYYAFGLMGMFYLVEFPFLLWYISRKVMTVDRQGLNRRQRMLYMLKSIGCAGMVLFMQMASWYFMYYLIGLLAYPLVVIALLGSFLITFTFLTASTALLLLPCITRCRRCPQQSGPIVFLTLIALICGGFTLLLVQVLEGKWTTSYNSSQIVSGIFASGILALLTYTLKSVFTQYMLRSDSQEDSDESDEPMLLSA